LLAAVQQGLAKLGMANRPELYRSLTPVMAPGTAATLLDEERGSR
jgi:hypothetical protein